MSADPNEVRQKSDFYAKWLDSNKTRIPNADRLTRKLRAETNEGHVVHAEVLKRFFEDKSFEIIDVELHVGNHDIDIQLKGPINIQVWHGASTSSHEIAGRPVSGGVKTDWEKDEAKLHEKLDQLPENDPGFVVCYDRHLGILPLPEWYVDFPENRAIIEWYHVDYGQGPISEARLHSNPNFKYHDIAKKIASSLGLSLKPEWWAVELGPT